MSMITVVKPMPVRLDAAADILASLLKLDLSVSRFCVGDLFCVTGLDEKDRHEMWDEDDMDNLLKIGAIGIVAGMDGRTGSLTACLLDTRGVPKHGFVIQASNAAAVHLVNTGRAPAFRTSKGDTVSIINETVYIDRAEAAA